MPESASNAYRRKLKQADNGIYNAICELVGYYVVLVRSDPTLAAALERVILDLEDHRETIHKVHVLAWEKDDAQFDTIGSAAELLHETRQDFIRSGYICQDYSKLWDRSVRASYRLLEKRAKALEKPSDLRRVKPES